jgi:hypothetical protein
MKQTKLIPAPMHWFILTLFAGTGFSCGEATADEQITDSTETSHEVYMKADPRGSDGGVQGSEFELHTLTCDGVQLSPLDHGLIDTYPEAVEWPTYPYVARWIQTPGEFFYVPVADAGEVWDGESYEEKYWSGQTLSDTPHPMDPVSGFTREAIANFSSEFPNTLVPKEVHPFGDFTAPLKYLSALRVLVGGGGFEQPPQVRPSERSLSELRWPDELDEPDGGGIEFGWFLGDRTTKVEFTVPASKIQEGLVYGPGPGDYVPGVKAVASDTIRALYAADLMAQDPDMDEAQAEMLAGILMGQGFPELGIPALNPSLVEFSGEYDPLTGLPLYVPARPVESYKLRGWFIRGDGLRKGGETIHPLIVAGLPHSMSITGTDGGTVRGRKLVYHLVMLGYSVLLYDYQARGHSDGWNWENIFSPPREDFPLHAPDPSADHGMTPVGVTLTETMETGDAVYIFHILDQLAGKSTVIGEEEFFIRTIGRDGQEGSEALIEKDEEGRITTPVVIYGQSFGANTGETAMHLRFDTPRGSDLYGLDLQKDYSGYNIRGLIDSGGANGSTYFMGDAYGFFLPFWLLSMGVQQEYLNTNHVATGEVLEGISTWPALFILKPTHDFYSPEGAVEAYNRARGHKELLMVRGWHGWGPLVEPNFSYTLNAMHKFLDKILVDEPDDPTIPNTETTTWLEEVCKAPAYDLYTLGEPPSSGRLLGEYIALGVLLESLCSEDGGVWVEDPATGERYCQP